MDCACAISNNRITDSSYGCGIAVAEQPLLVLLAQTNVKMPGKKKKKKEGKAKGGGEGKLPPPPQLDDERQGAVEAFLKFK